jgi:hypothetical protein
MVPAMREPNLEELRLADSPLDRHAGAGLNAFNRSTRRRYARLGTWWERELVMLSLIFVTVTVVTLNMRTL